MARITVCGAGGFIGHHLVKRLKAEGHWVRGIDLKKPEFGATDADEFLIGDLREMFWCRSACRRVAAVYQLAADMGGIGFIADPSNHFEILRNNALINLNMLEAAREASVGRYLFTSSACIYPQLLQLSENARNLQESDAYPADPEPGYGWEKLVGELACSYLRNVCPIEMRVVRFHNIYGPMGTFVGGREKAPAAICRKVALAQDGGEIEIWGDGEQTRSFCYIVDCVTGLIQLMESDFPSPVNLGTEELVSINTLVDMVCRIAGKTLTKKHVDGFQGVRGRNSDNTLIHQVTGWAPTVTLDDGLAQTYQWISSQLAHS